MHRSRLIKDFRSTRPRECQHTPGVLCRPVNCSPIVLHVQQQAVPIVYEGDIPAHRFRCSAVAATKRMALLQRDNAAGCGVLLRKCRRSCESGHDALEPCDPDVDILHEIARHQDEGQHHRRCNLRASMSFERKCDVRVGPIMGMPQCMLPISSPRRCTCGSRILLRSSLLQADLRHCQLPVNMGCEPTRMLPHRLCNLGIHHQRPEQQAERLANQHHLASSRRPSHEHVLERLFGRIHWMQMGNGTGLLSS